MIKREVSEIKKLFTPSSCCIDRICGCYVNHEKEKITTFRSAFLSLPEEESFKYFEIFKKGLSGKIGKNLHNLEFPLETEAAGGTQEFLLRLRNSHLSDDELLEEFYDKVIESYSIAGNYIILLIHETYDIPGKASDGMTMADSSDEVYDHILCCLCPMNLAKPGLSYNARENCIQNRERDWIVDMPLHGFLFPAFNDRSTDIHSMLYYMKKSEDLQTDFVNTLFGCQVPISADTQKELFQTIIEETIGDSLDFETAKTIQENLLQYAEEKRQALQPASLDKRELKKILEVSDVCDEALEQFDLVYDRECKESDTLNVENITTENKFEVKSANITIQAKPECMGMLETRIIDGRKCLVIAIEDKLSVNGMIVSE